MNNKIIFGDTVSSLGKYPLSILRLDPLDLEVDFYLKRLNLLLDEKVKVNILVEGSAIPFVLDLTKRSFSTLQREYIVSFQNIVKKYPDLLNVYICERSLHLYGLTESDLAIGELKTLPEIFASLQNSNRSVGFLCTENFLQNNKKLKRSFELVDFFNLEYEEDFNLYGSLASILNFIDYKKLTEEQWLKIVNLIKADKRLSISNEILCNLSYLKELCIKSTNIWSLLVDEDLEKITIAVNNEEYEQFVELVSEKSDKSDKVSFFEFSNNSLPYLELLKLIINRDFPVIFSDVSIVNIDMEFDNLQDIYWYR